MPTGKSKSVRTIRSGWSISRAVEQFTPGHRRRIACLLARRDSGFERVTGRTGWSVWPAVGLERGSRLVVDRRLRETFSASAAVRSRRRHPRRHLRPVDLQHRIVHEPVPTHILRGGRTARNSEWTTVSPLVAHGHRSHPATLFRLKVQQEGATTTRQPPLRASPHSAPVLQELTFWRRLSQPTMPRRRRPTRSARSHGSRE